jgi:hypothetical protein
MNPFRFLIVGALGALLAGCAGSVSKPLALQPLEQNAPLRLSDVSADAEQGVRMSEGDLGLISQKVKSYIEAESPDVFGNASDALKMKIHFTRFDRGDAFARAMMAGLGQIKIDATVMLDDVGGKQVAAYNVSKDFAFGGLVGATTTVEDVEEGFAKSVAEIVKHPSNGQPQTHSVN